MQFKKFFIGIICTVILFSACEKEDLLQKTDSTSDISFENKGKMTKLGQRLENPYSVESMKKAYASLKSVYPEIPEIEIAPTHLYIRFLPKDYNELAVLKRDSSLLLYETPLDFEIAEPGIYYHDPQLPMSAITWQYCSVEAGKILPEVYYEILSPLFIPQETKSYVSETKGGLSAFYRELENESLRLTGNLKGDLSSSMLKSSWRPAGRIRVWDDNISGYRPMEGVDVRARRWFTTHVGRTNTQGYYSCDGTFEREANYNIQWDRYDFSIRSGTVGQATYDGPKKEGDWNLDIYDGESEYQATIFRAAQHYYYGNVNNLKRPPQNSALQPQMKIAAMYEVNDDYNGIHAAWKRVLGILNWIKIYNPQNSSREIYATTIHELAHASHWDIDHSDFNDSETIVKESWARGVQWALTTMIYPTYSVTYSRRDYTGIVQDMLDGFKITSSYYYSLFELTSYKSYQDNVSGYTIKQIEDAVDGSKTFNSWMNSIINKYDNETETNLNEAFAYWAD